jgi:hypothetical protein
MTPTLPQIVQALWRASGLPGRCYTRRSGDQYVVHRGRAASDVDPRAAARFVRRCRAAFARAGIDRAHLQIVLAERWVPVQGISDRIEMWSKSLQRCGTRYQVVRGGWTSVWSDDGYSEEVVYEGPRRGALSASVTVLLPDPFGPTKAVSFPRVTRTSLPRQPKLETRSSRIISSSRRASWRLVGWNHCTGLRQDLGITTGTPRRSSMTLARSDRSDARRRFMAP